jgi:hypothetical protein
LGGYIPPSYDASVIENWTKLKSNLGDVIPTWEKAQGYNGIDQTKLSELLSILYRRQNLAEEILGTISKNAWLSDDQQSRIKADETDSHRAEQLASELNNP